MSRGTALGRVTKCLKDHHVDTTKKLKKAPKEWQELFICDRESHEREGEARIFHVGLEDVRIGELADFSLDKLFNIYYNNLCLAVSLLNVFSFREPLGVEILTFASSLSR